MKTDKTKERAKKIEEGIRLAWDSLNSHLPYTHGGRSVRGETYNFHKRCVRDYAKIISILTELY